MIQIRKFAKLLFSWLILFGSTHLYADVTSSAVRLLTATSEDSNPSVSGTGIFAEHEGKHYLITAYHVVYKKDKVFLAFNDRAGYEDILLFVERDARCFPAADVCVFSCSKRGVELLLSNSGPYKKAPMPVRDVSPERGWRVAVVGNPLIELFEGSKLRTRSSPINVVGAANVADFGEASTKLRGVVKGSAEQTNVIMLGSFEIAHGFSGGPVLYSKSSFHDVDYQLVGMLQGGDPISGDRCWAVTTKSLIIAVRDGELFQIGGEAWPEQLFASQAFASRSSKVAMQFPMKFPADGGYKEDRIKPQWPIKTKLQLSANGRLDGWTTIGTDSFLDGWHGEVIVFLCDEVGNVLWITENRHRWGVPAGTEKYTRDNHWDESVPEDVLPQVRSVKILHRHSPKSPDDTLQRAIALATVASQSGESSRFLKQLEDVIKLQRTVTGQQTGNKIEERDHERPRKIIKAEITIWVYDDDKECGAAGVAVEAGDANYKLEFGQGEDWEETDPPTGRSFVHNELDWTVGDEKLFVYGRLDEKPGEVNIDAGLKFAVTFTTNRGEIWKYQGQHYFRTGNGDTSFRLPKQ